MILSLNCIIKLEKVSADPYFPILLGNNHHGRVGWSTLSMTFMSSILFNSDFTWGSSGIGILRGVVRFNGLALLSSLISVLIP